MQHFIVFVLFQNTPVARSVGRVTAVDADGKLSPNRNGVITYSIIAGNEEGLFNLIFLDLQFLQSRNGLFFTARWQFEYHFYPVVPSISFYADQQSFKYMWIAAA